MLKIKLLFVLALVAGLAFYIFSKNTVKATGSVTATLETTPVVNTPDSADDMAVWIHPTDSSLSTLIATDKKGYLNVYDLNGAVIQSIPFMTNNVDLRYNFLLGGERVAIVTGIDRTNRKLFAFKVNPSTRMLEDVGTPNSASGLIGNAMYVSPVTGKYYVFTNFNGLLKQYEMNDNGAGRVSFTLVRSVQFAPSTNMSEGVVADDIHAKVYVSDEPAAIWKLGAEPGDGDTKTLIDQPIANGGNFLPDVEGLAVYYKSDGKGYLFASSQGNATYTVYDRDGSNSYIGSFSIADGSIDGVSGTDGIDVTNFPLGPAFPNGAFIAQDGRNKDNGILVNQNFKFVPFETIAGLLGLTMDNTWDPRLVGLISVPTPTPTAPVLPTDTPLPTLTPVPTDTPVPTVTPTPTPSPTTLVFYATDDTYTNSNSPNKNFGSASAISANLSPVKNIYLKYNVAGLNGRTVEKAEVKLYSTDKSDRGGVIMQVPDNSWTQTSLNYNNAPSASGTSLSSLGAVGLNSWYAFDVTQAVNSDGVFSFRINSNTITNNGVGYASKEYGNTVAPQLVITLSP